MDEVRELGGPTVRGACTPGAPGTPWPMTLPRRADIFGHKGDSCCAPENTLRAITQALDKGANFIEVDVQQTKDGVAVVIHDDTVDRTSNGSGSVNEFSRARLRFLDAGGWFHPTFAGEQIPSLAEVLALCKGRARVYLDGVHGNGAAIARAMQEAGVGPEAVWPWALSRQDIDELRSNIAGVEILYANKDGWEEPGFFERMASQQVTGFSIRWQDLSPDFAAAAHAHGMYVEVYTLFDPANMIDVVTAGADGLETDYPAILRAMEPTGSTR
jgi:glycerophosphoryl diester phosphodiesterase